MQRFAFLSYPINLLLVLLALGALKFLPAPAFAAPAQIKLLLTSNIQGRSYLDITNQDTVDPLLILAQNILAEKRNGADLYLDLGNAFYPGMISKFSSGSVMMDFFDFFNCAATLISTKDLQIGMKNLEFLQKGRSVHLLSANIEQPTPPVFAPYFTAEIQGVRIAFVGVSSSKVEFDIAEKDLYGIALRDEKKALMPVFEQIKADGIEHIILLSGLKLSNTLGLLQAFEQIDMALCGGDYTGSIYEGQASRIDMADGRSIIMVNNSFDYLLLNLNVNKTIALDAIQPRKARPIKTIEPRYREFAERLAIWKTKYYAEQDRRIASISDNVYVMDDGRVSQLFRDHFNSELAIVDRKTINTFPITRDIRQSDVSYLVNLDYTVFTFLLTGEQIQTVAQNEPELVITGLNKGEKLSIQGYPLEGRRKYKVAATQSAFENIERRIGQNLAYTNSWKTVTELLVEDLENSRASLRSDYAYLDRRYRTLLDAYLSNFVATGGVDRGPDATPPSDQPAESYSKWGLEDKIDLAFYNQFHRFVLTPYLVYARQDNDYLQNLLRATFLYEYNISENFKPYNKFQCDSVVEEIRAERPILIRETAGVSFYKNYFKGKLGLGFEQKVQDPAEDALYGLELIAGIQYPFLKYFTYALDIDGFFSIRNQDGGRWGMRCAVDNAVSARVNAYLSFSVKYKYFYLYEDQLYLDSDYRSSQLLTTLDLKTDWKFW